MRVLLDHNPLAPIDDPLTAESAAPESRPHWLEPATPGATPAVDAYRLRFTLAENIVARIHVSADERYELWLDGARLGRGPERGTARAWRYESFELRLAPGEHILLTRVWRLGWMAPEAQISTAPGFLLAADAPHTALLATGVAPWEVKALGGYTFAPPDPTGNSPWFTGPVQQFDGAALDWDAETGAGDGWALARARREDQGAVYGIAPAHALVPATLPAQFAAPRPAGTVRYAASRAAWANEQIVDVPAGASDPALTRAWQALIDGAAPLVVPPHSRQQIILDLGQYTCAYPQLRTAGGRGSRIVVGWAEALALDARGHRKGQRDAAEGGYFAMPHRDVFLPDGGAPRRWPTIWWRAGRFVQVLVTTGDEALTIEALALEETRYPLEAESHFASDHAALQASLPVMLRGLQMCAHETYMDCPYYEQMMYVGDTRLEALTTYSLSRDDRLPRKALSLFAQARASSGLVPARAPGRDEQIIPPFALWWVAMLHDYALWRGDLAFVAGLLPTARAILDTYSTHIREDGLLGVVPGWNFSDWVPAWPGGVPPEGALGPSGLLNWQLVYTLGLAAQLEEWAGAPELARRYRRERDALASAVAEHFWDEARGLYADDLARSQFSEHCQCLALIGGRLPAQQRERVAHGLLHDAALARTTIYFTHYLFEAYRLLGASDALFERLQLWFDLPAQGFTTTPEQPEPSRSDCHGWGAHPYFHCFATLLGIRPAAPGFAQVDVAPLPGPLGMVEGTLVHPRGTITVQLRHENGALHGTVALPDGVSGTLRIGSDSRPLVAGSNTF